MDHLNKRAAKRIVKDWKIYFGTVAYLGATTTGYAGSVSLSFPLYTQAPRAHQHQNTNTLQVFHSDHSQSDGICGFRSSSTDDTRVYRLHCNLPHSCIPYGPPAAPLYLHHGRNPHCDGWIRSATLSAADKYWRALLCAIRDSVRRIHYPANRARLAVQYGQRPLQAICLISHADRPGKHGRNHCVPGILRQGGATVPNRTGS